MAEVYKLLKEAKELAGHEDNKEFANPYVIYQNWKHIIPIELQFQ